MQVSWWAVALLVAAIILGTACVEWSIRDFYDKESDQ